MVGANSTAVQGGIRDCGHRLVLTGNNPIALNCPICGRRERTARCTENLSADFSPDSVTWPLSLSMSDGAGTLNFGVPCGSLLPGVPGLLAGELEQPPCPRQIGFVPK